MENKAIEVDTIDPNSVSSPNSACVVLDYRLRQKIVLLEDSLAKIASVRKQLKDNAAFVKDEICQSFNNQLDTLRNRESALTAQLETLANAKDEILSVQQNQLHEALGKCRQALDSLIAANLETGVAHSDLALESLYKQIKDVIDSCTSLELRPRERPCLTFEVDSHNMRRTVQTFGRISFMPSAITSNRESLPSHVEEEDESKCQMFVKPFKATSQIMVNFPLKQASKLSAATSKRSSDLMLMKDVLTATPDASHTSPSPLYPGSIDQLVVWLQQLKSRCETEPSVFENFELKKESESKSTSMEFGEDFSAAIDAYFKEILLSPASDWLLDAPVDDDWLVYTTDDENEDPTGWTRVKKEADARPIDYWLVH